MPAISNIMDVYISISVSMVSSIETSVKFLSMNGSWIVELNTAWSWKGDPGAQTEATHMIKHITSNPKP